MLRKGARLKRAVFAFAAFMLVLTSVQSVFTAAAYATTNTWVDGAFPTLTVGAKVTPPTDECTNITALKHSYLNANGTFNPLGRDVPISVCVRGSQLGLIGANGYVVQGPYAYQTTDSSGRAAPLSVYSPSGNVYYAQPTPFFGPSTYLSFPSGLGQVQVKNNEDVLVLPQDAFTHLKDSGGNDIIKMPPTGFSNNGKWMVFYAQGLGSIRLNTQTKQMLLFDKGQFNYDLGFQPSVLFAISDDGNTVLRSGVGSSPTGSTAVYDLSGCVGGPFVLNAANSTAGCKVRNTLDNLRTANPNFVGLENIVFTPDGQGVWAVADIMNGSVHETHSATYTVAGYTAIPTRYLALGDSFSSGEGAFDYVPGTDEGDFNNCHTSKNSYPYLVAKQLQIPDTAFHDVACSGAKSINYFTTAQHDHLDGFVWLPGEDTQKAAVINAGNPDVITISMIGNDIGFVDKIKECLKPTGTCFDTKEKRQAVADEIYSKFDTLVAMYQHILRRSGGAKVYVMGYPQIMSADPNASCGVNTPFDPSERAMAQGLITYLDAVIKAATQYAGVQYIDVENAFDGNKLCEPNLKAVNGLTAGNDMPNILGASVVGNESFHPNAYGQSLMYNNLIVQSQQLTSPMPAANPNVAIPYVGSTAYNALIGNAPSDGTGKYTVGTYSDLDGVNIILQNSPTHISDNQLSLDPSTNFSAVLYSTPTSLGTIITDANGHINGDITIPSSVPAGLHTLHLTGKDIGGRPTDVYKTIYVGSTLGDLNGNGTPDNQEKCVLVPPSGTDVDRDSVDDACDPEITQPPADTTPPTVTGTPDRAPDANGWYNADVTIGWNATDPDPSSGIPTKPADTVAGLEGGNTYTSDQSCDPLNNCATGSLGLKIDKTAPQITYSLSPAPNAAGWNNGSVTVTFNCADATSGVASCSDPVTVNGNDGNYVASGNATDNAGNTNGVNLIVNLDGTGPTVTQAVSPAPNANGWNNTDVMVTPTCNDNLSGILSCDPAATLTTEGPSQLISHTAVDNAGNTTTASTTVKIDKTTPQITYSLSQTPTLDGWNNTNVTVTFDCSDALSGVATCSSPALVDGPDGTYSVSGYVIDNAGNFNSVSLTVKLDRTMPGITQAVSPAPNASGWNNTDVIVTPTCNDVLAGVLSCDPIATVTAEGASQQVNQSTVDKAGNSATANVNVNIDKTAPTLVAPTWTNNPKATTASATITLPTTDNLSGVAAAEYYLGDTDPGLGNGATMQVNNGDVSVNFGTDFPTGVYKVTVRVKDLADNWSQPVSDYLVVYDPAGARMTGKKVVIPSLTSGDILPGLISGAQTDQAKFGFNVRYDATGNINPESDFQLKYSTGTKCNKLAQAVNCHNFELNASSINWLVIFGTNSSAGMFQGTASLNVDGVASNVTFRATGLDGALLNPTSADHLTLNVYNLGANPDTATPIYQVSQDLERGNIKIRRNNL